VKLLAAKRYEDAVAAVHDPDGAWTAARFAAELQPYWAEHATLLSTPEARRPHLTGMRLDEEGVWRISQRLLDPAGNDDWVLEGHVDLIHHPSGDHAGQDDQPLVTLDRIGV